MEIKDRKELKKICKDIELENKYTKYTILTIFSVFILARIQEKTIISELNSEQFKEIYDFEIKALSNKYSFIMKGEIESVPEVLFNQIAIYVSSVNKTHNLNNVLAWAYQYLKFSEERSVYSSSLNEGKKIEGNSIASATQFFTEDYMVNYLIKNSVSKLKLDRGILQNMHILDPACGGGNFLVYTLEYLYRKMESSYSLKSELLKVLIEKVLIGYEIDRDLAEIASINICLKAIQLFGEASFILDLNPSIFSTTSFNEEVGSLYNDIHDDVTIENVSSKNLINYNELFKVNFYNLIVTNPPFMGKRNMSLKLLNYLKHNYPDSKGDLCIAFMERCIDLLRQGGILSTVNQNGWMYLKSFTDFRKKILNNTYIKNVVDLGSNSFYDISGEKTSVALTIIEKAKLAEETMFINLKSYPLKQKEEKILSGEIDNKIIISHQQNKFLGYEGFVLQYESTNTLNNLFENFPSYKEFATPMQGTSTGDNKKFIDFSWKRAHDSDWVLVSKGGGYSKWSGLNIYRVKWGENANLIKENPGSAVRNLDYIDKTELVYSDTGTRGLSVRLLKKDQKFIASGPGIRIHDGNKYAHMAFLNTRTVSYFLKLINPKFTIAAGYIGRIPVTKDILNSKDVSNAGKNCYKLKESYLKRKLGNEEYLYFNKTIYSIEEYLTHEILIDLKEELLRLKFESELEKYIQLELNISDIDLNKIKESVGSPVFEIENENLNLSVPQLDVEIRKRLNDSCQYVSKRKMIYGNEGILEEISATFNVNPRSLNRFIKKNIKEFKKVRRLYYNDLLHKVLLSSFGFSRNMLTKSELSIDELIISMKEFLPFLEVEEIHNWILHRFDTIHFNTFYKHPMLKLVKQNDVIVIKRLDDSSK